MAWYRKTEAGSAGKDISLVPVGVQEWDDGSTVLLYRGQKAETIQAHIVMDLHPGVALSVLLVCSYS